MHPLSKFTDFTPVAKQIQIGPQTTSCVILACEVFDPLRLLMYFPNVDV